MQYLNQKSTAAHIFLTYYEPNRTGMNINIYKGYFISTTNQIFVTDNEPQFPR